MSRGRMRWRGIALLVLCAVTTLAPAAHGEMEGRKVKYRVTPTMPQIARQMNLRGTVRLEVVIAANGSVKSTRALGGHPLLIRAATEAVQKWKYEPGAETTTVIEFRFNQQD